MPVQILLFLIDFLIQTDGNLIPIEVKSGNTEATSLNSIIKNSPGIPIAYKLIDGNIGEFKNKILSIPLYMAMFLYGITTSAHMPQK